MDQFYVYGHFDESGECRYIGKGKAGRAWVFTQRSKVWKEFFGDSRPYVEILEDGLTEDESYASEVRLIDKYEEMGCRLLNVCPGGRGGSTWMITPKVRDYLSSIRKGEKHWAYGKKRSEATREKIRLTKALNPQTPHWQGKPRSQETKDKISKANKGNPGAWLGKKRGSHSEEWKAKISANHRRHQTEETRQRISEAKKGRSNGLEGTKRTEETKAKMSAARKKAWDNGAYDRPSPRAKPVRCIELDKVFESAASAATEIGCSQSKISLCCNGKRKTHHKYHWEYV